MAESTYVFADGDAYERLIGRWSRRVGDRFLDWLAPAKGRDWIDVGCGNGAFTERIVARAAPRRVFGVDPSAAQIAHARAQEAGKAARYEVGDALALPAESGAYDFATMALVLAFVPDPPKGVAELARALKPGGVAAAYMWELPGGAPVAPFWRATADVGLPVVLPPSADFIEPMRMAGLWSGAGFSRVETTTLAIGVEYDGVDALWDLATAPGGPRGKAFAEMADADKRRLRARLEEILVPDADGKVRFECRAHAVKGVA